MSVNFLIFLNFLSGFQSFIYFPLYFLTFGHSTVPLLMSSVLRVTAINIAAHRLGSPQDLFSASKKFSGIMLTVSLKVVFSLCLMSFSVLSRLFLEGFDDEGKGRKCHFSLTLLVLNGQFHCPQTPTFTVHQLPCGCHHQPFFLLEIDPMADTLKPCHPVHLRHMTLILGSNLGSIVEVDEVRRTWIQDN